MSQSTANKKILEDFDYKKLKEDLDSVSQNLQKIAEEVINMKVECVMANMELACTVDGIDFDSKVKDMEGMIKVFVTKEDMAMSEDTENKEHDTNT